MEHAYYLHTNGDIISKPASSYSEIEGDLVKKKWLVDTTNRKDAWIVVLESLAMGCDLDRAKELANRWGLDFDDSKEFIRRVKPTEILKEGFDKFVVSILGFESYDKYGEKAIQHEEAQ